MNLLEYRLRPPVTEPVVICAFGGWNDGGEGATGAVRELRDQWGARRFASIDPEEFYDFQVHRPTVRLNDGESRRIEWPANVFWWARVGGDGRVGGHGRVGGDHRIGGRDVVVFVGLEPNVRWRTYCEQILRVCSDLGASVLVTLGAFLADVPHTVPSPVSSASSDPAWSSRPGMMPARYEGPTGIVGVLNDLAARAGTPAVSVWGASPHYLPQATNPKVSLALLERIRDLLDLEIETGKMEIAAHRWEREVTEAIDEDGNLAHYVKRLEEAAESGELPDPIDVPSGEDLAAELERYLREHGSTDE